MIWYVLKLAVLLPLIAALAWGTLKLAVLLPLIASFSTYQIMPLRPRTARRPASRRCAARTGCPAR